MATIELELDEPTMTRLRRLAEARRVTLEQLLLETITQLGANTPADRTLLVDALPDDAMRSREFASSSGVLEALKEIEEFKALEADWDLEGASPIDREAADLAGHIVERVHSATQQRGVLWQPPVIGPAANGGIALTWEGQRQRTLLLTRPGQPLTLECVTKQAGAEPVGEMVSIETAIERALLTMDRQE